MQELSRIESANQITDKDVSTFFKPSLVEDKIM